VEVPVVVEKVIEREKVIEKQTTYETVLEDAGSTRSGRLLGYGGVGGEGAAFWARADDSFPSLFWGCF